MQKKSVLVNMAFTYTMQNPFRSDAAQGMTNSLAEIHGHQFALQQQLHEHLRDSTNQTRWEAPAPHVKSQQVALGDGIGKERC